MPRHQTGGGNSLLGTLCLGLTEEGERTPTLPVPPSFYTVLFRVFGVGGATSIVPAKPALNTVQREGEILFNVNSMTVRAAKCRCQDLTW